MTLNAIFTEFGDCVKHLCSALWHLLTLYGLDVSDMPPKHILPFRICVFTLISVPITIIVIAFSPILIPVITYKYIKSRPDRIWAKLQGKGSEDVEMD